MENPPPQQPYPRLVSTRRNFPLQVYQKSIQTPVSTMEQQTQQQVQRQQPPSQITHAQIQQQSKSKEKTCPPYQDSEKNKNFIRQIRHINLRPQIHLRRHFKIQHPATSNNQVTGKILQQTYIHHHFHHIVAHQDQQESHHIAKHNMDQQLAVATSQEPNNRHRHHCHTQVNSTQIRPVNMKPASPIMIDHQQHPIDKLDQQQNLESNIQTVMTTKFADESLEANCIACSTFMANRKQKIFSIPV
jgi:hypothetical protein